MTSPWTIDTHSTTLQPVAPGVARLQLIAHGPHDGANRAGVELLAPLMRRVRADLADDAAVIGYRAAAREVGKAAARAAALQQELADLRREDGRAASADGAVTLRRRIDAAESDLRAVESALPRLRQEEARRRLRADGAFDYIFGRAGEAAQLDVMRRREEAARQLAEALADRLNDVAACEEAMRMLRQPKMLAESLREWVGPSAEVPATAVA